MEIEAIGRNISSNTNLANSSISQEEFIELFLAQLSFQDPLEPMDNSEFLAQLAQFSSIAQMSENGDFLESIAYINSASQGASLLGKNIEVRIQSGTVNGTVSAVKFTQEGLRLSITRSDDGSTLDNIRYAQILQVIDI